MINRFIERVRSILDEGDEIYIYDDQGKEYELMSFDKTEFGVLIDMINFDGTVTIEIHESDADKIKVMVNEISFICTDGDTFTLRRSTAEHEEDDYEVGALSLEQIEQEFDFENVKDAAGISDEDFEAEESYDPYGDDEVIRTSDDY